MRDLRIGKRVLELNALLISNVKDFVLVTEELSEPASAEIIKKALPKIFDMIEQNNFPFIAKDSQGQLCNPLEKGIDGS